MDADPEIRQPDFDQAAQSLRDVALQLERCQNLPAVDGGAQLVRGMEAVLERFAAMERRFEQRFAAMEHGLEQRFAAMEHGLEQRFAAMEHRFEQRFAAMEHRFEQRFDAVDARMDDIVRRARVADLNTMARAENSTATKDVSTLVKLYSIVTGQEIVGCPSTVAEVKGLHARDAERFLRDLGLPVHGNVAAKRRRLLFAFGVVTQAV